MKEDQENKDMAKSKKNEQEAKERKDAEEALQPQESEWRAKQGSRQGVADVKEEHWVRPGGLHGGSLGTGFWPVRAAVRSAWDSADAELRKDPEFLCVLASAPATSIGRPSENAIQYTTIGLPDLVISADDAYN